jgi:hypothetical protein
MSQFSRTIRKIKKLENIIDTLPAYQMHFAEQRYDWVKPEYLNEKIKNADEYFTNCEQIDTELSTITPDLRQKREKLEDLTRSAKYLLKSYLISHQNEELEKIAFPKTRQIEDKSKGIIHAIEQFIPTAEKSVDFVDWAKLKEELSSVLEAYTTQKAKYDDLKTNIEVEKQELLQKEDEIDDFYHEVVNTIEGVLHEDRDVLLKLMPWRVRKINSTQENTETEAESET